MPALLRHGITDREMMMREREFELAFMFGASEPEGIKLVGSDDELLDMAPYVQKEIRDRHAESRKNLGGPVSLVGVAIDHGLNAHSGNGGLWRTTPVLIVSLDYLKKPKIAHIRLPGDQGIEVLAALAKGVAIQKRYE